MDACSRERGGPRGYSGGDTTATEGRENTQQASSEGETRRRDSRKYQSYIGEANDPPDEDFEENQAAAMEELIAEGLMRKARLKRPWQQCSRLDGP